MKIAILTLSLSFNYGGILQAYALQKILKEMGHSVEVLQRKPLLSDMMTRSRWLRPLIYSKRLLRKLLKDRNARIFIERYNFYGEKIFARNTHNFIHSYIPIRYLNNIHEVASGDYEVVIVGSDQVWRKQYFCSNWQTGIEDAFLSFAREWNITLLSYAGSFGKDNIDDYSDSDKEKCKEAAHSLKSISVREESGIGIFKNAFERESRLVLDPTMLLNRTDYLELIKGNKDIEPSLGDMLCYILDDSKFKREVIANLSEKLGMTPFNVYAPPPPMWKSGETYEQPPVESWLKGFQDAKFVITDSFHACVFSLIFNKPFVVIGNKERGMSRFNSLLKIFNQQHRLILPDTKGSTTSFMNIRVSEALITPPNVEDKLQKLREESFQFLYDNLKEA